jgi:hypothetical protein
MLPSTARRAGRTVVIVFEAPDWFERLRVFHAVRLAGVLMDDSPADDAGEKVQVDPNRLGVSILARQSRTDIWKRTMRPRALLASWPTIGCERYVSCSAFTSAA